MRPRRLLPILLAAFSLLVLVEVAVNVLVRPQQGPAALAAIFETHLLALAAVAALLAALLTLADRSPGASRLRLIAVVTIVLAVVRLGGEWWSPSTQTATTRPPAADQTMRLDVLSWNLELGSRSAAETAAGLASDEPADLVALQELTPAAAAAIEGDPAVAAAYPYRILEPRRGVLGMGLLSRLPLVLGTSREDPMLLRAGLLMPDGSRVEVLNVHPFPPRISTIGGVAVGVDTRRRDEDLALLADAAAGYEEPRRVLLVGDLNTTPFEPGFAVVARGLLDAHAEAGTGTGFTWRPGVLEPLGIGLLRIDHALSGPDLRPVEVGEDCSLSGDHCRLRVTYEVAPGR